VVGTQHFQAPEISGYVEESEESEETSEYSNAVDIWSLGCVVYKLLARQVPFPNHQSLKKFCEGKMIFPEKALSTNLSAIGIEFIKNLLLPKASERLTAETALETPWLEVSHETLDSTNQQGSLLPREERTTWDKDNVVTADGTLLAYSSKKGITVRRHIPEMRTLIDRRAEEVTSILLVAKICPSRDGRSRGIICSIFSLRRDEILLVPCLLQAVQTSSVTSLSHIVRLT
jgi:serine/threonine protein kinase